MLRQVFIIKDGNILYKQNFGKALDDENYKNVYDTISKEAFKVNAEKVDTHDFFKYRITYITDPKYKLLILFVTDLADKQENVKKEIIKCKKEFLGMFEPLLEMGEEIDEESFEVFDPVIESIHKSLRPKISLVGFSGVGKTTITRLITAQDIPMEHIPTITGDIGTIKIGKLHFHLWDFAGQEQFSFLWNKFVQGSDAILLITDSTLENVEKSRYFTELIKKEAPYAHVAVIGNKQDLPDALPIPDIERILGHKAYSMIAIDPNNRDKMIQIIADVLEMSGEVSPLLKPLIERDKKIKEAEEALQAGDLQKAAQLFDELSDLCLELGDDRVSQDFHKQAQKIRQLLAAAPAAAPQGGSKAETKEAPAPPPAAQAPPVSPPPASGSDNVAPPPPPAAQAPPVTPPPAPKAETVAPPPPPTAQAPPVTPPPAPKTETVAPPPPVAQAPPATPPPENKPAAAQNNAAQAPSTPATNASASPAQGQNIDKLGLLLQNLTGGGSGAAQTPAPSAPAPAPQPAASAPAVSNASPAAAAPPPVSGANTQNEIEKLKTELKIKIANVNKKMLDLEMDNITGDLDDETFKQKTERLQALKEKLQKQLDDLNS